MLPHFRTIKSLPIGLCLSLILTLGLFSSDPVFANRFGGTAISLSGWKWQAVIDHIERIKNAGYSAILLSPHTATCSGAFGGQGYDPSDFKSFNSGFGNEGQLAYLIKRAHQHGIHVYADMVMNHMCAKSDYNYDHFGWDDFHHYGRIEHWHNVWDLENRDLFGLNDLKHESPYVHGQLFDFLVKTNNLGFDGYRWDAVKHVPRWYWQEHVVHNVNAWGKYNFGELVDSNNETIDSYVNTGMAVTDYGLYDKMKAAFRFGGDLRILDGAGYAHRNGAKALTFVENHDVAAPQNRLLAHAFIATYPGYPMFANLDLNNHKLNNLVWIHANLVAGPYINRWKEPNVLIYERQGNILVGINQSNQWQSRWVNSSWHARELNDYSGNHGKVWVAHDGRVLVSIPPMSYVMLAP